MQHCKFSFSFHNLIFDVGVFLRILQFIIFVEQINKLLLMLLEFMQDLVRHPGTFYNLDEILDKLHLVYRKIWKTHLIVNEIFGFSVLLICLNFFIVYAGGTYMSLKSRIAEKNFSFPYMALIDIAKTSGFALILIDVCNESMKIVGKIENELDKMNLRNTTVSSFKTFKLGLLHFKFKYKIFGLITLNSQLIFSVMCGVDFKRTLFICKVIFSRQIFLLNF